MTRKHTNNRMQWKPNDFGLKYGNKENNEEVEWIINMKKELVKLEEDPKAEIHIDLLKTTLKSIKLENAKSWWNTFTAIHDWLALEMSWCLQGTYLTECMTKGKTTLIQKDPIKGTTPNYNTLITCLPMMWKIIYSTDKGRYLLLANKPGIVPRGTDTMPKRSRSMGELQLQNCGLYCAGWPQNKTEKEKRRISLINRTDAGLCIYHLFVWSNLNIVHNS